jgi:hypothetical protein
MKLANKLIIIILLFGCASAKDPDDPIKNSRKLVIEGHKSLYDNGAFAVKGTSIKFIPPFSEAEVFILGRRAGLAKDAFSENVKRAGESVYILKEGTKVSLRTAGKVSDKGDEINKYIYNSGTKGGILIVSKSLAESYGIIGNSFQSGMKIHEGIIQESKKINANIDLLATELENNKFANAETSKFSDRAKEYQKEFTDGGKSFILGYTNLDDYLAKTIEDSDISTSTFSKGFSGINEFLSDSNEVLSKEFKEVFFDWGNDTDNEFKATGKDYDAVIDGAGLSFAILKSFARVTKAIFFDALLKPLTKLGILSVGYVAVNTVIYPVMFVSVSGYSVGQVMVEVISVGSQGAIYLVAPTAKLALAGLIGSGKFVAYESYNAADVTSRTSANVALYTSSKSIKGMGIITEGAGTYVLANLSLAGVTMGQTILGGGVAIAGTAAGTTVTAASGTAQVVNYGASQATAGSVAVAGTSASLGVAVGNGVYRIGKAVGVPMGIGLQSGVVMNYEMVSQLSAHSILAVSDFSYLVLSLEGGKWVVYAVKDTSGKAKSLLSGAVIDLNQVRKEGNEIVKVPVSEEEMEKMLDKSKQKKK